MDVATRTDHDPPASQDGFVEHSAATPRRAAGAWRRCAVAPAAAVALCVPFGSTADAAACQQWQVPASFVAIQDNGYWVTFAVRQRGRTFAGYAGYRVTSRSTQLSPARTRTVIGNARGGITGSRFFARVMWTYSGVRSIGQYSARIDANGFVTQGTTLDEEATRPKVVGWHASMPLTCAA